MKNTFATLVEAFVKFKQENGSGYVPVSATIQHNGTTLKIGTWAANVRYRAKQGTLNPQNKATLDGLGFQWEATSRGNAQRIADMKADREAGLSLDKVGKKYGITRQRVHQILKGR